MNYKTLFNSSIDGLRKVENEKFFFNASLDFPGRGGGEHWEFARLLAQVQRRAIGNQRPGGKDDSDKNGDHDHDAPKLSENVLLTKQAISGRPKFFGRPENFLDVKKLF